MTIGKTTGWAKGLAAVAVLLLAGTAGADPATSGLGDVNATDAVAGTVTIGPHVYEVTEETVLRDRLGREIGVSGLSVLERVRFDAVDASGRLLLVSLRVVELEE